MIQCVSVHGCQRRIGGSADFADPSQWAESEFGRMGPDCLRAADHQLKPALKPFRHTAFPTVCADRSTGDRPGHALLSRRKELFNFFPPIGGLRHREDWNQGVGCSTTGAPHPTDINTVFKMVLLVAGVEAPTACSPAGRIGLTVPEDLPTFIDCQKAIELRRNVEYNNASVMGDRAAGFVA
ncbi:MAG: hypothetical protein CL911_05660 [Deltaproteobacteria bacterium]|nr:hypothetical protein [Deltaproteobacteria bacterium]